MKERVLEADIWWRSIEDQPQLRSIAAAIQGKWHPFQRNDPGNDCMPPHFEV